MKTQNPNLAKTKALLATLAGEAAALQKTAGGSVTDAAAAWLAAQYLAATHQKLANTEEPGRWHVLRSVVRDWASLRRGDHSAARLQLDREELDWRRTTTEAEKEKEFRQWVKRPEIREELFPEHSGGLRPETLAKIEKELNLL